MISVAGKTYINSSDAMFIADRTHENTSGALELRMIEGIESNG